MLYDLKWNTKANPLSLDSLIAWLEKQNPYMLYSVNRAKTCLLGRYYKDMGFPDWSERSANTSFTSKFGRVANFTGLWPMSSYGAALERARKLATASSPVP